MLLALVFGFVLVLVGVTASALVAVASEHCGAQRLPAGSSPATRRLVELFVNGTLRTTDLDADGPSPGRAAQLQRALASLTREDEILRIEIRASTAGPRQRR